MFSVKAGKGNDFEVLPVDGEMLLKQKKAREQMEALDVFLRDKISKPQQKHKDVFSEESTT